MNSAFTHHHAETKAGRAGRRVRLAALACALALGSVFGAGSALAQHGDRRDEQGMQQQGQRERFVLPPQDRDQRQAEARAYEEQRRQQQYQDQQRDTARRDGRGGRMTPDERRDLRRQINEAGMDLYPPRR